MKDTDADASVAAGKFCIKSNNDEFQSRQASVFDQLNALEHIHQASVQEWHQADDDDDEQPPTKDDDVTDSFPELTSVKSPFKVPVGLPIKRSAVLQPDFKLHPEKWTKYTLSDVDDGALTEAANAETAEDFIRSRTTWKSADSDYEIIPANNDDVDVTGDHSNMSFGKFRMPEYVVGAATTTKQVKVKPGGVASTSSGRGALSFDDKHGAADESGVAVGVAADSTETSPQVVVDDSPTFRSIRKRQRNIRKVDTE